MPTTLACHQHSWQHVITVGTVANSANCKPQAHALLLTRRRHSNTSKPQQHAAKRYQSSAAVCSMYGQAVHTCLMLALSRPHTALPAATIFSRHHKRVCRHKQGRAPVTLHDQRKERLVIQVHARTPPEYKVNRKQLRPLDASCHACISSGTMSELTTPMQHTQPVQYAITRCHIPATGSTLPSSCCAGNHSNASPMKACAHSNNAATQYVYTGGSAGSSNPHAQQLVYKATQATRRSNMPQLQLRPPPYIVLLFLCYQGKPMHPCGLATHCVCTTAASPLHTTLSNMGNIWPQVRNFCNVTLHGVMRRAAHKACCCHYAG